MSAELNERLPGGAANRDEPTKQGMSAGRAFGFYLVFGCLLALIVAVVSWRLIS